ncbi:MAG TPA: 2Fe-2S iron-sulfur cluster-binding protein, partial [Paludibacter sp.]|nr:2Fe-2S iron-sulfur cluster-binding protein [Paludibacter sp.]
MKIHINNQPVEVEEGITILEACNHAGIRIPTLCYLKDISKNASCGVCVVEVKGARSLLRSCITKVSDGMEISTHTQRVAEARKLNVELLLANHPNDHRQDVAELQLEVG